ncbi:MAG: hypothetical protein [Diaphorina citri cimodo-like virus]|nr:MAG: hypothetical protein [Diaphorina citri cimodo-like virus]
MAELNTPINFVKKTYPNKIEINNQRDTERYLAVEAYKLLHNPPSFRVKRKDDNSYDITFFGIWKRFKAPHDYFFQLHSKISTDVSIESLVEERLFSTITLIRLYLAEILPAEGADFSAFTFWYAIYIHFNEYYPSTVRNLIRAAFQLEQNADELTPLIENIDDRFIIQEGNFSRVVLKDQTNTYHTKIDNLFSELDFDLISSLEDKEVHWFKNTALTLDDIHNFTEIQATKGVHYVYHYTQTFNYWHVFKFREISSLELSFCYNVYRNWRDNYNYIENEAQERKRITYSYGGSIPNRQCLIYSLYSAALYPSGFNPQVHINKRLIDAFIKETIQDSYDKDILACNWWVKCMAKKPFVNVTLFNNTIDNPTSIEEYTGITWIDHSEILSATHSQDDTAKKLLVSTLLNPKKGSLPPSEIVNVTDGFTRPNYFNWNIDGKFIFYATHINISVDVTEEDYDFIQNFQENYNALSTYRKDWNVIRRMTRRVIYNHEEVRKSNLFTIFGDKIDEGKKSSIDEGMLPCFSRLMQELKDKIVEVKTWNNSTLKLIGLLKALEENNYLDFTGSALEVQIFGAIEEPLYYILKLLPDYFKLLTPSGAKAVSPFLRTSVESELYSNSPSVIISDIDQSEDETEASIAEKFITHALNFQSYARKLVVIKLQYATPKVLHLIQRGLAQYRYFKVGFIKPFASGPYSLECFVCLLKGSTKKINLKGLVSWVKGRLFLMSPRPSYVDRFQVRRFDHTHQVIACTNREPFFSFCFRAKNKDQFDVALRAGLYMSERVSCIPVGTLSNYEYIIMGDKWQKRVGLSQRTKVIGELDNNQDSLVFPRSGPKVQFSLNRTLSTGALIGEAGVYNLTVKYVIPNVIAANIPYVKGRLLKIADVGGRSCELISALPPHVKYTVFDPHSLPSFIDGYDVDHVKEIVNWDDPTVFDDFDVVVATFVIFLGALEVTDIERRISYLKDVARRGKLVIFNYYSNRDSDIIKKKRYRDITYNENLSKGTFGDYEEKAILIPETSEVFQSTEKVYLGLNTIVSACFHYGITVNPIIMNAVDDYNRFCPLRFVK